MKNSVRKIANGKGYLNISECMQIPTGKEVNFRRVFFIGYYVGTSFRVIRQYLPLSDHFSDDLINLYLSLQVDYDVPLVVVDSFVGVRKVSYFNHVPYYE